MKVKIKGRVYDANREPIMLILDDEDKENIANMEPDATKYCAYPDKKKWTPEKVKAFMQLDETPKAKPVITE